MFSIYSPHQIAFFFGTPNTSPAATGNSSGVGGAARGGGGGGGSHAMKPGDIVEIWEHGRFMGESPYLININ